MEEKIKQDLVKAQLEKNEIKVSTLRLLLSEITNFKIQKGSQSSVTDDEVTSIIQKEIKKRKEAALGFRSGEREEAALKEEAEAKILEAYQPEQLLDEELTKVVEDIINSIGATSIQDMGKVIGAVMGKVSGQVEGSRVSVLVKERLQK